MQLPLLPIYLLFAVSVLKTFCVGKLAVKKFEFILQVGDGPPKSKDLFRLCPSTTYKCKDGNLHHICRYVGVNESCVGYTPINLVPSLKRDFVDGHNGLRNKVAQDFQISNMNILYWSDALSQVATNYLQFCALKEDPCQEIGPEKLYIRSNRIHRHKQLVDHWPGRVVREWYTELGSSKLSYNEYRRLFAKTPSAYTNFTQIIWPTTKFLGCGVAKMFRGYQAVCYYYPGWNESEFDKHFKFGNPCSECPPERSECSNMFPEICGRDIAIEGAHQNLANWFLTVAVAVIMWLKQF